MQRPRPLLHQVCVPGFYTCPIPYHLGESLQGREVYRYLEWTSDLELAMAAHILKLDRYRED